MSTADDRFLISSSTALDMTENLVRLLDTMIKNLPESELRWVYNALGNSLRIVDDIMYKITTSSTFDVLPLSDSM